MQDDLTAPAQTGAGTTFDFGDHQDMTEHEKWAMLPDGTDPWEYMLRFIERDLEAEGWDESPRIVVVHQTTGAKMGMFVCTSLPVPEETFRQNPMLFLGVFIEALKNDSNIRAKYTEVIGDSVIAGIVLSFEGYGISGTKEEVAAIKARGIPFADLPEAFESRNLLAIPRWEARLPNLSRKRGEEPQYKSMDDREEMINTIKHSRSHAMALALLLELIKMQEEGAA